MNDAFISGFVDELEKQAKSISSTFAPGKKIPKGLIKRTLARIVSPTVAGRADAAQTLRILRRLGAKNPSLKRLAEVSRLVQATPAHKDTRKVRFVTNRLLGAAGVAGTAAVGHKMLKKDKKSKK